MGCWLSQVPHCLDCLVEDSGGHRKLACPNVRALLHAFRARLSKRKKIVCDVCRARLDPALYEGHREVCGANRLRKVRKTTTPPRGVPKMVVENDDESDEMCVVCLAEKLAYAFLPCGHVACCDACGRIVDRCPVCRAPREGFCIVNEDTLLRFKCPHCGSIVAPALYEGHREVCATRLRRVEGVESNSGPFSPVNTRHVENVVGGGILKCCLECRSAEVPLVIIRPCGHRMMCEKCIAGRVTCPVCVREIQDVWKSYV